MLPLAPVEAGDQSSLHGYGRPLRAVRLALTVEHPRPALLAEVAVRGSALLGGPVPQAETVLQLRRQWEDALGGEDGGGAEGRRRLPLALCAVAMIQREWLRRGCFEGDEAALTLYLHCKGVGSAPFFLCEEDVILYEDPYYPCNGSKYGVISLSLGKRGRSLDVSVLCKGQC